MRNLELEVPGSPNRRVYGIRITDETGTLDSFLEQLVQVIDHMCDPGRYRMKAANRQHASEIIDLCSAVMQAFVSDDIEVLRREVSKYAYPRRMRYLSQLQIGSALLTISEKTSILMADTGCDPDAFYYADAFAAAKAWFLGGSARPTADKLGRARSFFRLYRLTIQESFLMLFEETTARYRFPIK